MGIYDELSQLQAPQPVQSEPAPASTPPKRQPKATGRHHSAQAPRRQDISDDATTHTSTEGVAHTSEDDTTSVLAGADLSRWRNVLADTETRGSNLRLTEEERQVVEDVVRHLRRSDRVKTSMNELARLGLMLLAHDYRRRGKQSIIQRVKGS